MNARVTSTLWIPVLALGLLAATGCSLLPEPKPDPTRYFVLASPEAVPAEPGTAAVWLRPVEIASYLRSRPIVVRRGENEIAFRDLARWGEPLDLGVGRVLREELLARGVAAGVGAAPRADVPPAEFVVAVRVLACEGTADGNVLFRAVWEISRGGAATGTVGGGEYRATGLRWDGKNEGSLVGRLSTAVGGLAAEIAAALPKKAR
jgi:uncharacterized lipoprotein YmbA